MLVMGFHPKSLDGGVCAVSSIQFYFGFFNFAKPLSGIFDNNFNFKILLSIFLKHVDAGWSHSWP